MPAAIVERSCDYCGLPAGSAPRGAAAEHPVYCCLGCRFAASVSGEGGEEGVSRWTLTKLGLSIFFSLNVMVFTMALWSQDLFAAPTDATQQARLLYDLFRYLALLFSLPVVFLLGGPLLESAWSDLTQRRISADLLLALGVLAALVYSMSSVFSGRGHVYFEVACMVLVAVTLGRWIEATGRWRTTQSLRRLSRLLPEQVQVVQPGGLVARRPLEEVRKGAVVRTLAGQCIPLDGRIVSGTASIDAQVITGESQPVVKGSGDEVFGGSLCLDGLLEVEVTADSRQGTLARLVAEVERAAHARGRWRRLADRLAALFVPLVIAVALMAMGAHWALADFPTGLMSALAVLLIACPCALAIATPLAVWSAMGRAAAEGVIFRGDDSINRLAAASVICFDKTGTLSTGTAHVDELRCAEGQDREDVLRRAAALAESSIHPLSAAIDDYARGALHAATATPALGHVRPHAGLGIEGRDSATGRLLLLGSERFLTQRGIRIPPELARAASDASARGGSVTLLAADGRACGLFVLREQLRPETASVVSRLKSRGLQIRVLTGDRPERATQLAGQLSLPVEAQLLPHDKLDFVRSLQRQGEHVVMVGDGVNDAPALAAADVGVAMGCGADVTRDAAGVCLLSSDLERLPWALGLAQRTRRTVRRNLTWAFGYNSVGVALAACGLLNPVLAAALMFFSSLLVVSSSLRLAGETASGEEGGAGADSGESSRPQSSPGSRIEQRDPEPLAVGGTP